jgi:hypothetical protein
VPPEIYVSDVTHVSKILKALKREKNALCNHLRNISLKNVEVCFYVVQGYCIEKVRS